MNIMHNNTAPASFEEFLQKNYDGMTLDELKKTHKNKQAFALGRYYSLLRKSGKLSRANKKKWIASARAAFKPGVKQPCVVCGRYQSVAHAHHLTPLHMQYEAPTFSEEFVWLCPTHHEGVHLVLESITGNTWPSLDGFSEEEKVKILRLAAMGVAK